MWPRPGPQSSTISGSCRRSCSACRRVRKTAPTPSGSAPAPASTPSITRRSRSASAFRSIEGWGMTEVAMPTWASVEPRQIDTRAFGRPLSGCEVRVVDDEDREVPPDVPGELTLRMTGGDPTTRAFLRVPEGSGGDRRGLAGRLVPHRRRRDPRGRRHALLRRPQEEHHSPQRREYRRGGSRGGAPGR